MSELSDSNIVDGERTLERSPQERYVRFDSRLGSGAYKTVFRAYDTDQGIDVAWNAIDIAFLPAGEKSRIIQEVQLLQKLEHKNIINFYGSWFSKEKNQVVFITEIMTSGTLKSYIKRVHFVKWKIIKRWCRQILEGLQYLHSQNPPIIHRDLKCENIFINGNTGDLRIGDLGLSTQMAVEQRAQSVLGTPEFMAPELYDENYDEKVDIYAFGMCVLEMVTKEVPYSECTNPAQIYKKVIAGIRPNGLQRVVSVPAKEFIELCLSRGGGEIEVSASSLLEHPFLQPSTEDDELVRILEDPLGSIPPITEEKSPTTAELSKELDMEFSSTSSQRRSVPNMTMEADPTSGISSLVYEDAPKTTSPKSENFVDDASNEDSIPGITEPMSGEIPDDNIADEILASMPGNESKVDNDRMNVMAGRGHRLNIDTPKTKETIPLSTNDSQKEKLVQADGSKNSKSMNAETSQSKSKVSPRDAESTVKENKSNSVIASKVPRPKSPSTEDTSIIRKRGSKHDIKATVDPENAHSILLNMRIMIDGKSKEIKFPFNLFTDSPHEVASELAVDVDIQEPVLLDIIDSIGFLVTEGKIKNLQNMEFDVWEEGPEPYSFSMKPLPHVSTIMEMKNKEARSALDSGSKSNELGSDSTKTASDQLGNREDAAIAAAAALLKGIPIRNAVPPSVSDRAIPFVDSRKETSSRSLSNSPPAEDSEVSITTGMPGTHEYFRRAKDYEDRLKIAQSAFDHRESSLEAAIRSEKEKHERELERYRKKMEEFDRKKQKAQLARQQRMEQVAAEFKAEVQAERRRWRPDAGQSSTSTITSNDGSTPSNSDLNSEITNSEIAVSSSASAEISKSSAAC